MRQGRDRRSDDGPTLTVRERRLREGGNAGADGGTGGARAEADGADHSGGVQVHGSTQFDDGTASGAGLLGPFGTGARGAAPGDAAPAPIVRRENNTLPTTTS